MSIGGQGLSGQSLNTPARPQLDRSSSRLSAIGGLDDSWKVEPDAPDANAPLGEEAYGVNPNPGSQVLVSTTGEGVADCIVDNSTEEPRLCPLPNSWSLHSVATMANRFITGHRSAALSVKCHVAHRLATESMNSGNVCMFVPHGHAITAKKCDQGMAGMNTIEAFKSREGLRGHGEIVDVLHEWWGYLIGCKGEAVCHGYMTKAQYMESGLVVMKNLCPDEKHAYVVEAVEEDWNTDAQGQDRMNFTQFFDCMFELADMWCDSIDGHDYAEFLRGIYTDIANGRSRGTAVVGHTGMWHAAKTVMSMPKNLYAAGGYNVNNFTEREKLARGSVKEIMAIVDKFNSNGKITVTEMQAHLDIGPFGGFSMWMTRYNRRNWMRFDTDKDGRIGKNELYDAMMAFLVCDSYGREFDRVGGDDQAGYRKTDEGWKRNESKPNTSNQRRPSKSGSKPGSRRGSVLSNVSPCKIQGDLPSSWLHMQNICNAVNLIDFASGNKSTAKFHFMRCANVLTDEQMKDAMRLFKHYCTIEEGVTAKEKMDLGVIEKKDLFMMMGMMHLKITPDKLKAKVDLEFAMADVDQSNSLDFNEFKSIYNKVVFDELTEGSNIDDYVV